MLAARRRTTPELLAGLGSYALRTYRKETEIYRTARMIERNMARSAEDLLAEQDQAIAAIVNHAYLNSPFYRAKYDDVGFKPGDVHNRSDLAQLPPVTKRELVSAGDTILTAPAEQLHPSLTGGTTGQAMKFYRDRRCLAIRRGIDLATLRYYGWREGQWQGWLWGAPRDAVVPSTRKGRLIQNWAERTYFFNAFELAADSYRRFVDLTRRHRPPFVSAYPSLAHDLALRIESGEIEPLRVPLVSLTAEPAYPFQKEKIRQIWAGDVYERYGARDFGMAALECPEHAGLHYFTESVYFESADCGPEMPCSTLLVTDLLNYGMPIIRYQVGDFASIDHSPCLCGWNTPRLTNIQGRETDIVWRPDGTGVAGIMLIWVILGVAIPAPIQLVQEDLNHIVIRVEALPGESKDKVNQAIDILRREIGPDFRFEIAYVRKIERAPSGKYQYVLSKIARPVPVERSV